MREMDNREQHYLRLLVNAIEVCLNYQPKLGAQTPVSLERFLEQYSADAFYHWVGLDTPQVYRAHRAGGGITSLYRQLGIGCQRLFQQLLIDHFGLSKDQIKWSYTTLRDTGASAVIELDACVQIDAIQNVSARQRFLAWMREAARMLEDVNAERLLGAVFEVRQGYKSRDSKRQNADLQSAARAYAAGYMPVMLILSEQIDEIVAQRYSSSKWLILKGSRTGDAIHSAYTFCHSVIGFDLAGFLERNSSAIRTATQRVLEVLLGEAETVKKE